MLSLLSLQAFGATFQVTAGNTLQDALDSACNAPVTGPHTIEIVNPGGNGLLVIGPGSVQGNAAEYPSAACANNNPADIIIQPDQGTVTIQYQVQGLDQADSLFTFRRGPNVTMRNLRLIGRYTSQVPGDTGSTYSPECAATGDQVRGITFEGRVNDPGALTVENLYFQCLDGDHGSPRLGGGIYSRGVPVTVRNSVFDQNAAYEGAAVAIEAGGANLGPPSTPSLILDGVTFAGNVAQIGGAVSVRLPNHAVLIEDSVFDGNIGEGQAGGVNLVNVGQVTVRRTVFDRQNPVQYDGYQQTGGALRIAGAGGLEFQNNIVCGSWAGVGGGVYAVAPGDVNIEGSVFSENGALCYGGGLYVEGGSGEQLRVVNNSFLGNEAGRPPPWVQLDDNICAIGGGGAAGFAGMNPEFRNNVVAYQGFGGGVFGRYIPFTSAPGYQIGDELVFFNNLWWQNNDTVSDGHVTGDFASLAMHPSNLELDPQIVYLGPGEFNCVPEAFYPRRTSPVVNAGGGTPINGVPGDCQDWVDTSVPPDFVHDQPLANDTRCDIGAFGGRYGLFAKDTDGDGWSNIFDCNDNDPSINPGAIEACDFADNDCDGLVDEDFNNAWWPDTDGDGRGDANAPQELNCAQPAGKVPNRDDCNDGDATIYIGAPELCNGIDDDCDGLIDEDITYLEWFRDLDGDGYGDNATRVEACASPGPDWINQGGDCDDTNAAVNPGAPEICGNGIDDNCNGIFDPEDPATLGVVTLYIDLDGDGYGDMSTEPLRRCSADSEEGYAPRGGDCDDANAEVNPGAPEYCTVPGDEDCDGLVDEADGAADAEVWFLDSDGDGFGNDLITVDVCPGSAPPSGYVSTPGDCNDADALVGECSSCGCQATPSPAQGALGLVVGLAGLLLRRRR